MPDRARVVTTAIIAIVQDCLRNRSVAAGLVDAHAPIMAYLRGELADIERQVYDDIRRRGG